MKRKIGIIIIILLVGLQFIRPSKNSGEINGANAIATTPEIATLLQSACNDCHSNNTIYPWYTNIQPVGLWMQHHVDEGKDELNFSEFNTYTLKRKLHKLDEIKEMLEEDEMPLTSYKLVHGESKLTPDQKELIIKWASDIKSSLDTLKKM